MTGPLTIAIELTPDQLEVIAERVAEIVAERHQPPSAPDLLTVAEAAELMRCERKRVYRLLSDGRLPRVRDGGRVLVERAEVERHLRGEPPTEVTRVN